MFDILLVSFIMAIITTIFFAKEMKPPVQRSVQRDKDESGCAFVGLLGVFLGGPLNVLVI